MPVFAITRVETGFGNRINHIGTELVSQPDKRMVIYYNMFDSPIIIYPLLHIRNNTQFTLKFIPYILTMIYQVYRRRVEIIRVV